MNGMIPPVPPDQVTLTSNGVKRWNRTTNTVCVDEQTVCDVVEEDIDDAGAIAYLLNPKGNSSLWLWAPVEHCIPVI